MSMRGMIGGEGSTLFEELGLYYIGAVDRHNLEDLVTILENEVYSRSWACANTCGN